MRKAQSAVEAAIIIGMMTLILIVFLLVVSERNVEVSEQRQISMIDDLAYVVKAEADMAKNAEQGYNRTFTLPITLGGAPYDVAFVGSEELTNHTEIILMSQNPNLPYERAIILPVNVVGDVCKGSNSITKQKGLIKLACLE